MRGALLLAVGLAVGLASVLGAACYQPTIPAGVPCTRSGECPGGEACVAGICGGPGTGGDAANPIDVPPGTTVVVVGIDRSELADTELSLIDPGVNYGTQNHFSVDDGESGLLAFDLSKVPAGLAVTKATLRVVTTDYASADGGTVLLYRVLEHWEESTATWMVRTATRTWSAAGAKPPSREADPIAELRPSRLITPYDVSIPPAVVEGWRADPSTNHGLAFVRGTSTQHVHIATRDTGLWSTLTLELRP
jgi:hypothetical protein